MTDELRRPAKTRWNGWLTVENYDWLCRLAYSEDMSFAAVLNRIIKKARENGHAQDVVKST